ncbi:MAG TPA: DUF1572 family protein [Thermoanaerobaculia bacterium]
MNVVISAIEGEFRRYKTLAESALAQLSDDELGRRSGNGNSVAILLQHVGGNLRSRFSEFLTSDGEKPWRDRETEFADRNLTRPEILAIWESGWSELLAALGTLRDDQLESKVSIRGVQLSVIEALTRSLAHTSYHVGQVVFVAREIRGAEWQFLSIPPGGSAAYNAEPKLEKPPR